VAARLGLAGIPHTAEVRSVRAALAALRCSSGRLHLQHLSAAAPWRRCAGPRAGLAVTCEATPHHLLLSVDSLERCRAWPGPDPNLKMNPPLRTERDRQELLAALNDGTSTPWPATMPLTPARPRSVASSEHPSGDRLETTLALLLQLVEEGRLGLQRAVELLSWVQPECSHRFWNAATDSLADVIVVDPRARCGWCLRE